MEYYIKEYRGYRLLTAEMPMGHVCGYVEIPQGHYLFGRNYGDEIPELGLIKEKTLNGDVGKRSPLTVLAVGLSQNPELRMDAAFDVHGGITFSYKLKRRTEDKQIFDWAIGFDTNHFEDDWDVQNHEYCEQECKRLIDQIIEIDELVENQQKEF
jgi:hypothetical protein